MPRWWRTGPPRPSGSRGWSASRRERVTGPRRWAGALEDLPPLPAQGRGPMVCLSDVDADEDLDGLDIHLCTASRSNGSGPAGWTTDPEPTPAKDLTRRGRSLYQRSPVPGCPR